MVAIDIDILEIQKRLMEIIEELDEIGITSGLNQQRMALRRERDELLDQLCECYNND